MGLVSDHCGPSSAPWATAFRMALRPDWGRSSCDGLQGSERRDCNEAVAGLVDCDGVVARPDPHHPHSPPAMPHSLRPIQRDVRGADRLRRKGRGRVSLRCRLAAPVPLTRIYLLHIALPTFSLLWNPTVGLSEKIEAGFRSPRKRLR